MEKLLLILLLVAVTMQNDNQIIYCSTVPKGDHVCKKLAYHVCGISQDGVLTDFKDQCQACKNSDAVGYTMGECAVIRTCTDAAR